MNLPLIQPSNSIYFPFTYILLCKEFLNICRNLEFCACFKLQVWVYRSLARSKKSLTLSLCTITIFSKLHENFEKKCNGRWTQYEVKWSSLLLINHIPELVCSDPPPINANKWLDINQRMWKLDELMQISGLTCQGTVGLERWKRGFVEICIIQTIWLSPTREMFAYWHAR